MVISSGHNAFSGILFGATGTEPAGYGQFVPFASGPLNGSYLTALSSLGLCDAGSNPLRHLRLADGNFLLAWWYAH